jgi:hypothetical protein
VATGTTLTAPSFINAGTLAGGGTLNLGTGTLSNNGIITPGGSGAVGTFTITGNLVMGAGAAVNVDLTSPVAGSYDVLNVSGTATLTGGTLNIMSGANGSFNVLNATGGFGSTKFATINSGYFNQTATYTTNLLTIDLKSRMLDTNLLSELLRNILISPKEPDNRKRGPYVASVTGRGRGSVVVITTVCQ